MKMGCLSERICKSAVTWSMGLAGIFACLAFTGCDDIYGYGRTGYYAPGPGPYGPGYVGGPAVVSVEVGDRPYYTRGPGYYVGRRYYVWRSGYWRRHHGRRVWVHGNYILRP